MAWDIPSLYPVTQIPSPRWSLWGRLLSLCCFLLLLVSAGFWFLLHDSRVLLWAFGAVVGVILLFLMVAGWMLYSFGVDGEHAEGLEEYNRLQEYEWQRWAQQSVPVAGWHAIFPPTALSADKSRQSVNSDTPLTMPPFPGYDWLAEEIIMALLPELQKMTRRFPVEVCLPEGCGLTQWRQFQACWQRMELPASSLSGPVAGVSSLSRELHHWLQAPRTDAARLVVVMNWGAQNDATSGAVAWLLAPHGAESVCPVRCSLHRAMTVDTGHEVTDFQQYLHYQPLTAAMKGLWTDANSQPQAEVLMIANSQRLDKDASGVQPPLPEHYWLPHWLGRTGPAADWFMMTLMMQMAERTGSVQSGIFSSESSTASPQWILSSVSAGAFLND